MNECIKCCFVSFVSFVSFIRLGRSSRGGCHFFVGCARVFLMFFTSLREEGLVFVFCSTWDAVVEASQVMVLVFSTVSLLSLSPVTVYCLRVRALVVGVVFSLFPPSQKITFFHFSLHLVLRAAVKKFAVRFPLFPSTA